MPADEDKVWHDEISFGGDGFVELDKKLVSYDSDVKIKMTLEFSTWEREGLLVWQGTREQDYWGGFDSNYMALAGKLRTI